MTDPVKATPLQIETAIAERLLTTPFASKLGVELVSVERGCVSIAMPFSPDLVTVGETVHGGALATLADVTAVSAAISAAHSLPRWGATSTLSLTFAAPAQGKRVIATGRCLRAGSRSFATSVAIHDADGGHCVEALATEVLVG